MSYRDSVLSVSADIFYVNVALCMALCSIVRASLNCNNYYFVLFLLKQKLLATTVDGPKLRVRIVAPAWTPFKRHLLQAPSVAPVGTRRRAPRQPRPRPRPRTPRPPTRHHRTLHLRTPRLHRIRQSSHLEE